MQTHAAVAAMVQKKLQQRVERPRKSMHSDFSVQRHITGRANSKGKEKSCDRALPAGRFALDVALRHESL